MSKLAHICFTLIINKQFNFCRFRASAYTKVDRLCAVFLYNICCFHDFIETIAPIERRWITLIHYKDDITPKTVFEMAAVRHLEFSKIAVWSRVLYWHVILYFRSKFRINRPIPRRDIAKNDFQYGVRPPSLI